MSRRDEGSGAVRRRGPGEGETAAVAMRPSFGVRVKEHNQPEKIGRKLHPSHPPRTARSASERAREKHKKNLLLRHAHLWAQASPTPNTGKSCTRFLLLPYTDRTSPPFGSSHKLSLSLPTGHPSPNLPPSLSEPATTPLSAHRPALRTTLRVSHLSVGPSTRSVATHHPGVNLVSLCFSG